MSINPLKNRQPKDEPKRSSQEWCDHLNDTRRDAVNADRAKEGLGPIEWYVRDGQVAIRWQHHPIAMLNRAKRENYRWIAAASQ
jgi:hypothetical protein